MCKNRVTDSKNANVYFGSGSAPAYGFRIDS